MRSVLVQQSSGWISTPIRMPYFQELISCWWNERAGCSWGGGKSQCWRCLHEILRCAQNQNDNCPCKNQTLCWATWGCRAVKSAPSAQLQDLVHSLPLAAATVCASTSRDPMPSMHFWAAQTHEAWGLVCWRAGHDAWCCLIKDIMTGPILPLTAKFSRTSLWARPNCRL